MRFSPEGRAPRVLLALGAVVCLAPVSALAATGAATAPSGTGTGTTTTAPAASPFTVALSHRTLRWGQAVTVRGRALAGRSGQPVSLQFRGQDGLWRTIASGRLGPKGTYRFRTHVPGRGAVRVALATTATAAAHAGGTAAAVSRSHAVRVHATVSLATRRLDVAAGRTAVVAGHVSPRRAGRLVVAQRRAGHHWTRVAQARTDHNGAYRLSWRPSRDAAVRVVAGGDAVAGGVARAAGRQSVLRLRAALASRYDEYGGPLACGNGTLGYSTMGVANKTLPCGTKVTIRYRGRTVTVPVIDRGPYVGGREFDLSGATARALGFDGVGTIYVSTR